MLEYGAQAELARKKENKEELEEYEEKTIINFLHQEKRINGGFSSQGRAMYEMAEYEQSEKWSQKGLQYIEQIKGQL